MSYEVLFMIVVINAVVTASLWRKLGRKSNRGQEGGRSGLAQRADHTQTRSAKIAGGKLSSLAEFIGNSLQTSRILPMS